MNDEENRTLFIGNLTVNMTEDLLYELFLQAGPLEYVKIPFDRTTGKYKNFGFACYRDSCSAPYAVYLLNNTKLFGKYIKVQTRKNSQRIPPMEHVGIHSLEPEFENEARDIMNGVYYSGQKEPTNNGLMHDFEIQQNSAMLDMLEFPGCPQVRKNSQFPENPQFPGTPQYPRNFPPFPGQPMFQTPFQGSPLPTRYIGPLDNGFQMFGFNPPPSIDTNSFNNVKNIHENNSLSNDRNASPHWEDRHSRESRQNEYPHRQDQWRQGSRQTDRHDDRRYDSPSSSSRFRNDNYSPRGNFRDREAARNGNYNSREDREREPRYSSRDHQNNRNNRNFHEDYDDRDQYHSKSQRGSRKYNPYNKRY